MKTRSPLQSCETRPSPFGVERLALRGGRRGASGHREAVSRVEDENVATLPSPSCARYVVSSVVLAGRGSESQAGSRSPTRSSRLAGLTGLPGVPSATAKLGQVGRL